MDKTTVRETDDALDTTPQAGASRALIAAVSAIVAVTLAIAAYVYFGEKPPVATGEMVHLWVHPVHTTSTPMDAGGVQGQAYTFDQVLLVAEIKLHNQSKGPIFLREMLANMTVEDGVHTSSAAGANDFDRAFVVYPMLNPIRMQPLVRDTTLESGQSLDGLVIWAFHLTREQWEKRKDLNFVISFRYQKDLVLKPPATITEQ